MTAPIFRRILANPLVSKLRSLGKKKAGTGYFLIKPGAPLTSVWIQKKIRFPGPVEAASSCVGPTLLVGNKQDWRDSMRETLTSPISLSAHPLDETTVDLPEIEFILPFVLSEYAIIRASATASSKSLIPGGASVTLADDKLLFNNWLSSNGFARCVPKMFESDPPFPFIRKRRVDAWGLNSRIFFDDEQVRSARVNINDRDYILQECVSGREEYATHTISVSGIITYSATFINLYQKPLFIKGMNEQPEWTKYVGGLVPVELSEIIRLLDYSGCACFNYKIVDGVPMIFEMNPRVGASFSRIADQYLEGYLDSVRWHRKRAHL